MDKSRLAVIGTLALAVGLGAIAAVAIHRSAGRRAALADEIAGHLPRFPYTRQLMPWQPTMEADEAHAIYCLDEAEPFAGARRFLLALVDDKHEKPWKVEAMKADPKTQFVVFQATGDGYRLRGMARPGTRADCASAKRQVTLTVEAARADR